MTDHPDPPGPDDPAGPTSSDAELRADELHQLVGRLRDVPAPTASVRSAHLAAALDAYDALPTTSPRVSDPPPVTPVTPISSARRNHQRMIQRWAAAAALVLVAGLGVGLAVQAGGGSDDTASDAAVATQSKADEQLSAESGADAAAPEPASAATGNQDLSGPSTVLQLGEVADDDALRFALVAGRRAEAAQATREAAETGASDSSGMAVGGSEAPVTTAANAPAADQSSCASSYPPGAVVVAAATLDGRPVVVVETRGPSPATPTVTTVVDLTDCSTRQL